MCAIGYAHGELGLKWGKIWAAMRENVAVFAGLATARGVVVDWRRAGGVAEHVGTSVRERLQIVRDGANGGCGWMVEEVDDNMPRPRGLPQEATSRRRRADLAWGSRPEGQGREQAGYLGAGAHGGGAVGLLAP